MFASVGIIELGLLLFILTWVVLPIWAGRKIARKAGFSPLWAYAFLAPFLSLVIIWVFAFVEWPNLSQKKPSQDL